MNERESEMQHAISTLRSIALNEDMEEDDPLIICMETMDTSGMFRTLVLTLATLRYEVSFHILRDDSALHTTHKDIILNTNALTTVMGGSNDPGMEAAKRVNGRERPRLGSTA